MDCSIPNKPTLQGHFLVWPPTKSIQSDVNDECKMRVTYIPVHIRNAITKRKQSIMKFKKKMNYSNSEG